MSGLLIGYARMSTDEQDLTVVRTVYRARTRAAAGTEPATTGGVS